MSIAMNSKLGRRAAVQRSTAETQVTVEIDLDGTGQAQIATGIGFFDHMLVLFAGHGLFDLEVTARGDLMVDGHHTVEDTAIVLGRAIAGALGDKTGIARYGVAFVPMDEALAMVAVDISGRPFAAFDAALPPGNIGSFDAALTEEFFRALALNAGLTLHVRLLAGKNPHHIVEAMFKSLGRALADAVRLDERRQGILPSTKGVLGS